MRTAIFGAGSLGTALGAYWSRSGFSADLISRNRPHVEALNRDGAKVTGTVSFSAPVRAITPEEMRGEYDIVVLMTKQQDNRGVAERLLPFLKKDAVLCTAQNGLPEPLLAEIAGYERVIGCTVIWGATLTDPGIVRLTSDPGSMSFQIGAVGGGNRPQIARVKGVLQRMCPVVEEENFLGARWSKLIINAAFSGLSAAFGMLFGEVAENRRTRAVAQRLIKECIDVAKASDIRIEPVQGRDIAKLMDYRGALKRRIAFYMIPIAMKKHRLIKSGMLTDIERGRKSEADAINGVVSAFGARCGCPTPVNDRTVFLLHEMEAGRLFPSVENLRFFDGL